MFQLISTTDWRRLLAMEGPGFLVSMAIAESFYRFHSFTLECAAFLATWYIASRLLNALTEGRR